MLKFDNVPDKVNRNDLGGAPNAVDASFRSDGRETERSIDFIVWPAHDGDRKVNVQISTMELSALAGVPFGIGGAKITTALQNNRRYLERRANDELPAGASEVVLDVGALVPVR